MTLYNKEEFQKNLEKVGEKYIKDIKEQKNINTNQLKAEAEAEAHWAYMNKLYGISVLCKKYIKIIKSHYISSFLHGYYKGQGKNIIK
jgi:hypothetical protein